MEERRLGPVVGLGTWQTFGAEAQLAHEVVGTALEAGTRLFDSSPMYGGAEASLGAALAGRREGTVVATKVWTPSVDEGRRQYERQRGSFGRVEIEQVHNLVSWEAHLSWLEAERDEGRIDRIGVTHYAASSFEELERALATRRFDTVQVPLSPLQRGSERRILPLAAELGIAVIVMEPFGGTGAPLLRRPPPAGALEPLRALGIETWAQAVLAWILADPRVDVVIPATSRPDRARETARAGSTELLGPDERALVERLCHG